MSELANQNTDRLLVVKLGSSSVTRDTGPDTGILSDALDQALAAMQQGWRVVLVSSGAQSVGRAVLSRARESDKPISPKLAAAFGQPVLMDFYRATSSAKDALVSQFLIGESDLRSSTRMASIASVILESLEHKIIPIVNGNDPTDEGKTNNDLVAAGIAMMIEASHLLLLTDVEGVYSAPPAAGDAPLSTIHADEIHLVKSTGGGSGTGGIRSKLRAAEIAARNGVETRIASALRRDAISSVVSGLPVGTLIQAEPRPDGTSGTRKWISGGAIARGSITINAEAETSIGRGTSLFASGIKRVKGNFVPGDVVEILGPQSQLLGRGIVRLSAGLLNLIRALKVEEISLVLVGILGGQIGAYSPSDRARSALSQFSACGHEMQKKLVAEVIALFPSDNAAAIVGATSSASLLDRYTSLVSGLPVIHNTYLVEFHRRTATQS